MTGKSAGVLGLRQQCIEWHCALVRVDGKEGISPQIGLQYMLLLSNGSDYYFKLSTKLLSTKEIPFRYIEPS